VSEANESRKDGQKIKKERYGVKNPEERSGDPKSAHSVRERKEVAGNRVYNELFCTAATYFLKAPVVKGKNSKLNKSVRKPPIATPSATKKGDKGIHREEKRGKNKKGKRGN